MNAKKDATVDRVLVVSPESLSALVRSLNNTGQTLLYNVRCSDGISLTPFTLDELLNLPNSPSREIRMINLTTDSSSNTRIALTLDSSEFHSCYYTISGTHDEVVKYSDLIGEHVSSMSGPVSFLSIGPIAWLLGNLIFAVGLSLVVAAATIAHDTQRLSHERAEGAAIIGGLGLLISVVSIPLARLVRYLFPPIVFTIGAGAERYRKVLDLRAKLSFTAIAVAVICGLVVMIIGKMIGIG